MLTPVYQNPKVIPPPDIYGAVYDFLLTYALPAMLPGNIYRGWQNRSALPTQSNEYAVISVLGAFRRGTNVERLLNTGAAENQPESYQVRTYYETMVQLDFCSDSDFGRQRALAINTVARSSLGVAFLKPYGLTCQYADDIREMPWIDASQQFVRRYSLDLRLAYWAGVEVSSAWAAIGASDPGIDISRFEDVLAAHPVEGD